MPPCRRLVRDRLIEIWVDTQPAVRHLFQARQELTTPRRVCFAVAQLASDVGSTQVPK